MIKALLYIFIKLPYDIFFLIIRIILLPLELISKIINIPRKSFNKEADLYGLSKEDRLIAKEERMTPAEYIEAEENDDDNLDKDN